MARVEVEKVVVDSVRARRDAGLPVTLPDEYNEFAVNTVSMQRLGLWAWLKTRVLFRRAGAYELCDAVSFLLAYFCGPKRSESLGDFGIRSMVYGPELAALLDRLRWISQGSLSRALGCVDLDLARAASRELLQRTALEASRSALVGETGYRDGTGAPCEVFHWDVTVTTLRSRALPEDETLPPAHRIGPRLGAPGYAGRKRGELQISRSTVSEATSAVWLEADMQAGNGELHDQLVRGAEAVSAYLGDDAARVGRAVVVADGVSGGHPQVMELRRHGLAFVTRGSAYHLLEEPAAMGALETGRWRDVEDSRSGPRRQALEMGRYQAYEDLECRLVASRFPATETGRGAGKVIGSWHYELFLTDLPTTKWGAEDIVTLYYGRTAIENRFAAEDRDFLLDRILSCNLPGQMLACAVALAVWNLRLANGLSLTEGATPERPQQARPTSEDRVEAPDPSRDVVLTKHGPPPNEINESRETVPTIETVETTEASETTEANEAKCMETAPATSLAGTMNAWCACHPGWRAQPSTPAFVCPKGNILPLSAERTLDGVRTLRFRMLGTVCNTCPQRSVCAPRSTDPNLRREVTLRTNAAGFCAQDLKPRVATEARRENPIIRLTLGEIVAPPPLIPIAPALLPAVVRKLTTTLVARAEITVQTQPLAPAQRKAVHLALNCAQRQRRRLTIEQRIALNERPNAAATRIRMCGPPEFVAWMAELPVESGARSG